MNMRAKVGILIIIALILIPAVVADDALDWYARGQNAAIAGVWGRCPPIIAN